MPRTTDLTTDMERLVELSAEWKCWPTDAFRRISKILEPVHFGVQYIELDNWDDFDQAGEPPAAQYLNMGDTYDRTIVLTDDYLNGVKLRVCSWADWLEEQENHYCRLTRKVRCGYCGHFTKLNRKAGWAGTTCQFCKHKVNG